MNQVPPLSAPRNVFLEDRHAELRVRAQAWVDNAALEGTEDGRVVVEALAKASLLRACVPKAYGGLRERVELRDLVVTRAVLGYRDSFIDTMFAMQGLGSYPMTLMGTHEQKLALLPLVASGQSICAFAVTEPEAGSDVSAISTTARRRPDGSYALDGTKTFISNAGIADSYIVFARTGEHKHDGLSAFWISKAQGRDGMSTEPLEVIAPHPIGTVHFKNCIVQAEERIGEEGDGFRLAMATLDFFRGSVAGAALGMAARAFDEARTWCKTRKQFGKLLAEFQLTQAAIAEMAVDVATASHLVFAAAHGVDHDQPSSVQVAMAKLHATEVAQRVVDRSLQLHGGRGVIAGNITERLYREVRALRIYEGTSEIQKLVIARALLR